MKHKLTSILLAITLIVSMSVPAFAADTRAMDGGCPANALLWQMLCSYGGFCGESGCEGGSCAPQTQFDWNALLRRLIQTQPVPSDQPAETDAPDEPSQPAEQPSEPSQPAEQPTEPSQPAEPSQPSESPSAVAANAYEREVIRLVNAERAKYGLGALQEDAALTRTARMKSQDMHDNRYFDHNSPTYGTPFQLMKSQGVSYRTAGENIAMGYATPEAVVSAWMNSPGHRANILNASYTKIGVGYVASGNYWTQHFTG